MVKQHDEFKMSQTIAVLDAGTTRVTCFIAQMESPETLHIKGIGHEVASGMRLGSIIDMDSASNSMRRAVHRAETMAGLTVDSVFASISGNTMESAYAEASISVKGHSIDDDDIQDAFDSAGLDKVYNGKALLHAIPTNFKLDHIPGIRDPRGMQGNELAVNLHLVRVADSGLRNLVSCINRCDLEVTAPVNSAYASGLACLVQDEIDLGVTLIDLGGGTTNIAIFSEGELSWCSSLPIGGQHVTNDIAKGLSTPISSAERMKRFFASAIGDSSGDREMVEVPLLGESEETSSRQVPRSLLSGIVRPRLEETFELIRDILEQSHASALAGRRVVLTGGGSQLSGVADLASQVLDKQVRLAKPLPIPGLAEAAAGPDCAGAAGLLMYASNKHSPINKRSSIKKTPAWLADTNIGKISQWLRHNF
tara:strand:- start:549 stop:1817 length:1269 start_codon:yes stop_codon:yes gene_type:complete